jgi:CDP-paratose 2-epimerase
MTATIRTAKYKKLNKAHECKGTAGPWPVRTVRSKGKRHILITGGAGFIGTNLADRLLTAGERVLIYENLSRYGSEKNLEWLSNKHGDLLRTEIADVRDFDSVKRATSEASAVFHLAAQVAVTDSIAGPRHDFEVNLRGTLNVLEAIREVPAAPRLLFTSTNKVYGCLSDVELAKDSFSYRPVCSELAARGVSEDQPLNFNSPYGCSKGAADQYVLDYARTYRLPATVFRMSCIYGPHQLGNEDQGWVAHFLIQAAQRKPITIYGDGLQVRDVLFIQDLVDAFLLARESVYQTSGKAFNIGGGPSKTLSLRRLVGLIEEMHGSPCDLRFGEWRQGDQRYYVSNTERFRNATGWAPKVEVRDGVNALNRWVLEHACSIRGGEKDEFTQWPVSLGRTSERASEGSRFSST